MKKWKITFFHNVLIFTESYTYIVRYIVTLLHVSLILKCPRNKAMLFFLICHRSCLLVMIYMTSKWNITWLYAIEIKHMKSCVINHIHIMTSDYLLLTRPKLMSDCLLFTVINDVNTIFQLYLHTYKQKNKASNIFPSVDQYRSWHLHFVIKGKS